MAESVVIGYCQMWHSKKGQMY